MGDVFKIILVLFGLVYMGYLLVMILRSIPAVLRAIPSWLTSLSRPETPRSSKLLAVLGLFAYPVAVWELVAVWGGVANIKFWEWVLILLLAVVLAVFLSGLLFAVLLIAREVLRSVVQTLDRWIDH